MKKLFLLIVFALPALGYSVEPERATGPLLMLDEEEPRVTTGYTDEKGKQGFWVIFGKDAPEKTGYAPDGRVEEGTFKDNRKVGEWITYHFDGKTPKLQGNYVDGRPNGEYAKFNTAGITIEKGNFNNGKQGGEMTAYDDDGNVKFTKNFNAEGKENGTSTFFYPDGTVQYSYTKTNGVMTGESTRYWEDGSVKEIVAHGADGKVISTTVVNAEPPVVQDVAVGTGGPNMNGGVSLEGKSLNCDGYNKVYNKQSKDLWMDGEFKNCKLWDGKLYKYDSDGILLKFEVWKNGAYHSDGQL